MRRAATWSRWFGGLFALWLFLVGTVQGLELVAGLAATRLSSLAARRPRVPAPHGRARSPPQGTFRELEFPTGGERVRRG
jgi:hypothetical protein